MVGEKRRNWKEEDKSQGTDNRTVCKYVREDIIHTDTDKPSIVNIQVSSTVVRTWTRVSSEPACPDLLVMCLSHYIFYYSTLCIRTSFVYCTKVLFKGV